MSASELSLAISKKSGLKSSEVKSVLSALEQVAVDELKFNDAFTVPKICTLKVKVRPARKATSKKMFGELVKVKARSKSRVLKAKPAPSLKNLKEK
jgi:nucleoid DNA-binding protein